MKELGPNEGMNALRHPDCRYCDEYERLLRGPTEEVRQLKAKLEAAAAGLRARDELLSAIKQHRNATESRCRMLSSREASDSLLKPDRDLYEVAERVEAGEGER